LPDINRASKNGRPFAGRRNIENHGAVLGSQENGRVGCLIVGSNGFRLSRWGFGKPIDRIESAAEAKIPSAHGEHTYGWHRPIHGLDAALVGNLVLPVDALRAIGFSARRLCGKPEDNRGCAKERKDMGY